MRLLKLHSRGKAVLMLKELLHEVGFSTTSSTYFDQKTEQIVQSFQQENNLVVDGIVYTKTWVTLLNKSPKEMTVFDSIKYGAQGDQVRILQELLNQNGAQIPISGNFYKQTEDAVKEFQKKNHLVDDGIVGKHTWKALIATTQPDLDSLSTIRLGSESEDVLTLQKLLIKEGYNITADGKFGPLTESSVKLFQQKHNLTPDGIVGNQTWKKILSLHTITLPLLNNKFLSEADILSFAQKWHIEPAVIKAVNEVESNGLGFDAEGMPRILFEGHKFWSELKKRGYNPATMEDGFEDVLYPNSSTGYRFYSQNQWNRLSKAISLRPEAAVAEAAYCSASYGLFQIMGFHYKLCGYEEIIDFVAAMKQNEKNHLDIFGKFLDANHLFDLLRNHNWKEFAKRYNGANYAVNQYDTKLMQAYAKYR